MLESGIKNLIMVAISKLGVKVFTNPVGNAWQGVFLKRTPTGETILGPGARRIQYGLIKGSADLIGWKAVTVTPKMVGKKLAVFVGIEVKQPGKKPTPEQITFQNHLRADGAFCGVAASAEEAIAIVRGE